MIAATLPPRASQSAKVGYSVVTPSGTRIPVTIAEVRIKEQVDGTLVLTRVTDTGIELSPSRHNDVPIAQREAAEEFGVNDLNWQVRNDGTVNR
jgi:hypothetical protein